MTKYIRIENADTSKHNVRVLVQDRMYDIEKNTYTNEWKTVREIDLSSACSIAAEYIYENRRIVVEEY